MLAKRIIPTLLCRGRQLVKGAGYNSWRSIGVAMQAARIHAARMVDELCILDIAATHEQRSPDLTLIEELCAMAFTPIAVGGGIRKIQHVRDLLSAGADKVVIGSAMFDSDLVEEIAGRFGSQAVVVSIDVKDGDVWSHCGTKNWHVSAAAWARTCELKGAGEILLNSITREGMMDGYDLALIREVSEVVGIPVIASCGCGNYQHMLEAIQAGADAVAAGAMFAFSDCTPKGAAEYLAGKGLEVRL